ncbi:MAG: DUF421 domain-containing protein [Firmicutes bacterium]|nr:DUF421 domain-containing protein [Bacillota bacterium]
MGKRQIGEMEPFELVITLIIADIATVPMAETTIPIWHSIVPLLTIVLIHFTLTFATSKSNSMRNILSGKPVVVITPNGIDVQELKKANISIEELVEALRNLEYYNLDDINYAIIERNGKLSVIPKIESLPATQKDLNLNNPETCIGYCLIENGKVLKENLVKLGINKDRLYEIVQHYMLCTIPHIVLLYSTLNGDFYAQTKDTNPTTFKASL